MRISHPFDPVFNNESEILILGSFPSIKSRENNFYYAHPQNRFWKILERIYSQPLNNDIYEKKKFLLQNHIAIWDVIKECNIKNSSDSSISDVIVNHIEGLVYNTKIKKILCNGNTAYKYYTKFFKNKILIESVNLPSSSPANARYSLDNLVLIWSYYLN